MRYILLLEGGIDKYFAPRGGETPHGLAGTVALWVRAMNLSCLGMLHEWNHFRSSSAEAAGFNEAGNARPAGLLRRTPSVSAGRVASSLKTTESLQLRSL